jgi:hypothetical protein
MTVRSGAERRFKKAVTKVLLGRVQCAVNSYQPRYRCSYRSPVFVSATGDEVYRATYPLFYEES